MMDSCGRFVDFDQIDVVDEPVRLEGRARPRRGNRANKKASPEGLASCFGTGDYENWFIVLSLPAAFSAASPLKYSLWSSPMSEPDMF